MITTDLFMAGGVEIFFNALFLRFFFLESYITCIIPVVGAQQKHEGMFLKHGGGQKFSYSVAGWGGGGGGFFLVR